MHYCEFNEDLPPYVLNPGEDTNNFTVHVVYNGFFGGLKDDLAYESASVAWFDYCTSDTCSLEWIDEILRILGEKSDGWLKMYWCLPDKEVHNGLVLVEKYGHILYMNKASKVHKTLDLFIDHTNFFQRLRPDVPVYLPGLPALNAPVCHNVGEASSSNHVTAVQSEPPVTTEPVVPPEENAVSDDSSSDSDFELYDSAFNVEDSDDDLFAEHVDVSVNDHNEHEFYEEHEDEDALEYNDLNLQEGDKLQLQRNSRHYNEESQFKLLMDYGQELRRSNPGSRFFLTTNFVGDPESPEHKQHLATLYWSYDACKRGFLAGCRPVIFLDGFHIKTKYKGQLLTTVEIDPNDCIYPVAFGLVEVECASSWEWFLSNLKEDLNITNTSP